MTRLLTVLGITINPWIILGAIAFALGAGMIVYNKGYNSAEAKCDTSKLQSEIAALKKDNSILENQLKQAKNQSAEIEKQWKKDKDDHEDFVSKLSKTKAGVYCQLTEPDARSLRN